MPATLPAIFFGILPLMDETGTSPQHTFESCLFTDPVRWPQRDLEHGAAQVTVQHFVEQGKQPPVAGTVAFCSGNLTAYVEEDQLRLKLSAFRLIPFPGNPESEDYPLSCPPPSLLQLCVVGFVRVLIVQDTPTAFNMRGFELTVKVYDKSKQPEQATKFAVRALFPLGPRWKNYHLPNVGATLAATGEIIGTHEKSHAITLAIQSLETIPSRAGNMSAAAATPSSSQSPAQKKGKWSAWLTQPSSPSAGRSASTKHQPSPAKTIKKEKTATAPTANMGQSKKESSPEASAGVAPRRRSKKTRKVLENLAETTLTQITLTQAPPATQVVPQTPIILEESSDLSDLSDTDSTELV